MTTAELCLLLESITGFADKVTYDHWPIGEDPAMPYICYMERGTDNFKADGKVYKKITDVDIELYSEFKDISTEELIETALDNADIPWDKSETYIDSERCYQIIYEITI